MKIDPEWKMVRWCCERYSTLWFSQSEEFLFSTSVQIQNVFRLSGRKVILRSGFSGELLMMRSNPIFPRFSNSFLSYLNYSVLHWSIPLTILGWPFFAAYSLQAERAIQWWCRLQLDWWPQSSCWYACRIYPFVLLRCFTELLLLIWFHKRFCSFGRWLTRWCLMLHIYSHIIHQLQRKHTTTGWSLRGSFLRYPETIGQGLIHGFCKKTGFD